MNRWLAGFGGLGILALFVFAFVVGPMIALWAINTLAEQSGTKFYIPHGFWTYLSVYGLMAVFGKFSNNNPNRPRG